MPITTDLPEAGFASVNDAGGWRHRGGCNRAGGNQFGVLGRHCAGVVDLDGPWRWLPVYDAVSEVVGERVTIDTPVERLMEYAAAHGVVIEPGLEKDKVFLELLSELVEPHLLQPTFLCDYPAIAQPLARPHRSRSGHIEAWDLIIAGVERGTGFTELVDPVIQRATT